MMQISPQRENELNELEQKIGTSFLNKALLNQALLHSSFGHEKNLPDNERLEYLGDAVIKLAVSEYIFNKFPEKAEGDLTKIRASVISDETLSKLGRDLNLGEYLLLSANEKRTGGTKKKSNLANTFEALVGAVYLDAGLGKSREIIISRLEAEIERISRKGYIIDYKSALQEFTQKRKWQLPHYPVMKESGLRHRRVFWVEVKIKGQRYGMGRGGNKKEAEQRAATQALKSLDLEEKQGEKKVTQGIRSLISQVRKRIKL